MDSKNAMLILGLMAMVFLISSEVSARDLTETSTDTKKEIVKQTNEVNDAKYGGGYHNGEGNYYNGGGNYHNGGGNYHNGGGNYHNGGGNYHNGGGNYHNGGGHHGGGYCQYNCCGGYSYGSCRRCCSYAGEAVDVQVEGNTHN
ncbi:dormancy-associated protein 2-like [Trifolium pratense]|uniref:dormancy-associated protein 2-like n=1 Tax=Trifolium pratense TaxID=57577 RepID=UPI001E692FC0|nr:dormancy-associated protein 2-like [Trifolium pratense]